MKVSDYMDIKIDMRLVRSTTQVAWVNLVLDDAIAINDLRLMRNACGVLFVQWPASQMSISKLQFICCPINQEAQQQVDDTIIAEYERRTRPPVMPAQDTNHGRSRKKGRKKSRG